MRTRTRTRTRRGIGMEMRKQRERESERARKGDRGQVPTIVFIKKTKKKQQEEGERGRRKPTPWLPRSQSSLHRPERSNSEAVEQAPADQLRTRRRFLGFCLSFS